MLNAWCVHDITLRIGGAVVSHEALLQSLGLYPISNFYPLTPLAHQNSVTQGSG